MADAPVSAEERGQPSAVGDDERDRRRRVLVLAPFPPRLDGRHGGSRAIAQLVTALAGRNRVALAYLRAGDEPPADPAVLARCERVHEGRRSGVSESAIRPWPRAMAVLPQLAAGRPLWVAARWNWDFDRAVRALAAQWRPDVVQAEFSAMAPYAARLPRSALRVVTVHEPGETAARQRVEGSRGLARLFWRGDAQRWRRFERTVLDQSDVAVAFSDADRAMLQGLGSGTRVVTIPLAAGIPDRALDPVGAAPPQLLFVGSFVHPPNLDAALHLATVLYPRLRALVPGLTLALVGEGPPPALRALANGEIDVPGWVADLTPRLDAAAIVMAPLRLGGGMRVKVAESLGAGKVVAGTPLAFAGIPVTPGVDAVVSADDDELVAAVAALLTDPARRAAMGRAARELAVARLGGDRSAAEYERLYERLSASAARGDTSGGGLGSA